MAEKTATKDKKGISPGLIVMGALGLGLIIWGVTQLGGPKGTPINAKFNFDHQGLAGKYKFRVRFGNAGPLGVFNPNPDLVKIQEEDIPAADVLTPGEVNVKVLVLAKKNMVFPLPYTYDAEAMIIDEAGGVVPGGKVITENVFTQNEDFEVEML
jgi:hypothetical protein